MAEVKLEKYDVAAELNKITASLSRLETAMNERFEKLKEFLVKYLTMGNEFALGSLKAALKSV